MEGQYVVVEVIGNASDVIVKIIGPFESEGDADDYAFRISAHNNHDYLMHMIQKPEDV